MVADISKETEKDKLEKYLLEQIEIGDIEISLRKALHASIPINWQAVRQAKYFNHKF